ncbi:phosphate acyltransferase PlsX [Enterococcus faecalis]|jgi:glycerol-3-phosphate acyltransferase PlsX|uniref:phosphate acyltransferase PlsX n=1 Tax=Enterococcus faecalis TaxID=1351 RepID=UPI000CF0EA16|nr:phosphate acyltransferase PlsX [Enterococcus faecalis]EGO5015867.1 phosphate acyltransferase PlsX [Enterococcus faecalis]EGO5082129.1 phosphate acyltransferase PlsX [Enterococcus faecalis]EGO6123613.1 phosphate acyltransferase PlsX [Enterococcus faecalis]EGO6560201.1 phosphate acyltransferase PlsX [Enterococcus faecalis]EGO7559527.1 phosphate acyltransferase PlsX [Enterococcus faecalis]
MKIAVDAMGGDNAPQAIVEGVMLAKQDFPDIEFQLYGKEAEIKKYITDKKNITIIHTDEKIASDDEPVKAIRRKKTASMVLAAQAVKNGEADAIFSAGNTGALLAAGLFIVGRIKNVERPGLMSTLPVMGEPDKGFDMLDLGANADNKPEHLVQYAVLGSFYAEKVRNVQNPRVGLLNNGTEETKGSELTKKAFELLAADETINFVGNVEARELLNGVADVVVTDGFTGNAVLKSIEGTAMNMMSLLKTAILSEGVKGKMGALLLKNALRGMKDEMDYSKHGGAVLFGLKAPVIKTHGATGPDAVRYTIRQIHTMLETQVVPQLVEYYEGKAE